MGRKKPGSRRESRVDARFFLVLARIFEERGCWREQGREFESGREVVFESILLSLRRCLDEVHGSE